MHVCGLVLPGTLVVLVVYRRDRECVLQFVVAIYLLFHHLSVHSCTYGANRMIVSVTAGGEGADPATLCEGPLCDMLGEASRCHCGKPSQICIVRGSIFAEGAYAQQPRSDGAQTVPATGATEFSMYQVFSRSRNESFECNFKVQTTDWEHPVAFALWRGCLDGWKEVQRIAEGRLPATIVGAQAGALDELPPDRGKQVETNLRKIFQDAGLLEGAGAGLAECVVGKGEQQSELNAVDSA
ncbi:unnamed protein product [Prorocentrum cordatum]|uniref:Uncharacterized protein n=1 Tax=Prorocentrum cordatum TaxID=2364126 RepID=A0ABN9U601_9DINO|nr:unnamed protein product [Polarella glacialis]